MTSKDKLKVLCIGAGAIGTYIGGSLAINGHEIHFVDRPDTLKRIKNDGFQLQLPQGNFSFSPNNLWDSTSSAISTNNFDFCIIAVKSYDTDTLIQSWIDIRDKFPPVLCLQNGVENEEKISQIIGHDKTISGTVSTAIGRIQNGIVVEKLRGIGIEEKNELTQKIIEEMQKAGLKAQGFKNPRAMKWSKLLTNVTTNASCAILNMTPKEIMENPNLFKIEIEQLREVIKVMNGHGIRVVDLPGTPVRLFALIVKHFPYSISRKILSKFISKGRGGKMPSFYLDLVSGSMKSEVDYLNGAVVRYGEKIGIPTPINSVLNETLLKLTADQLSIELFNHQPQAYLQLFK
ncbi:MAG TPA: ketopantoate reductase family protein [Anaerolineaceae bacterium]|nr:ketopantoate reductase family protein [Anaerolineaceae bacterium]